MASSTDRKSTGANGSPLSLLQEELGHYLKARLRHMTHNVEGRLTDVADHISGAAEGDGLPLRTAARMLKGESPKQIIGEETKKAAGGVVGKVKEAVGGGGGEAGDAAKDTKATHFIEVLDVGVPLRTAYDHWTEYEKFPSFAKGVQDVSSGDETTSDWTVKVAGITRKWKAHIQEQLPDDRIIWNSEGAQATVKGAVSFHEITPTLTRIILVVVYYPSGFLEKTGNLWRAQGRRLRLDFKGFQRYVTLAQEEVEGWRGEVRDGEVTRSHEEVMAEDGEGQDEAEETEEEGAEETEEEAKDAPRRRGKDSARREED